MPVTRIQRFPVAGELANGGGVAAVGGGMQTRVARRLGRAWRYLRVDAGRYYEETEKLD
jgi:hypothetical protein